VTRLFQIVGIILLVLWAPITTHCYLEKVPGLEFLKCDGDTPQKDCSEDSCSVIEKASYKIANPHTEVPAPPVSLGFDMAFVDRVPVQPSQALIPIPGPEDIPQGWQFSFRTALLPRAPTFAS